MNSLAYGLLCLLATNSYTGYELMLKIQPFWQAKHSQIYPLLATLERDGHVQFEEVAQSDKPDKKIYSLTDKGLDAVKDWIAGPTADPITRDECMLKAYCISIVDTAVIQALFTERLQLYRDKLVKYQKHYDDLLLKTKEANETLDIHSPKFGLYIVLKKAISNAQTNLEWCQWVLSQTGKDIT